MTNQSASVAADHDAYLTILTAALQADPQVEDITAEQLTTLLKLLVVVKENTAPEELLAEWLRHAI